jgi:DNA gyrase/topoisomerase IV subunit A
MDLDNDRFRYWTWNCFSKYEKSNRYDHVNNGYGKRTPIDEYKVQNRGGSGIKTANVTDKTGPIVGAKIVTDDDSELIAISQKSQVIRTELDSIPVLDAQHKVFAS